MLLIFLMKQRSPFENEYVPIGSDSESEGLGVEGRTLSVATATVMITAR
jgi:hypothetical protein